MEPASGSTREEPYARAATWDRADIGAILLAAAATAIMLQATRVFLSYMVFIIDQSERVRLGTTAAAVYLAIALGAILARLVGKHRVLALTTIGMVATRLTLQFWEMPEARMWLGAATIVLVGWLLPILFSIMRAAAAFGVGVGLAVDVAFRIGRGSVDLPLMPTAGAHLGSVALALVAVAGVVLMLHGDRPGAPGGAAIGALALGPALALHHLLIGNLGTVELRLEASMPVSAWLLSAGMVLGLGLDLVVQRRLASPGPDRGVTALVNAALAVAGAGGLLVFWQDLAGLGAAGVVIGTAATVALVVEALRGSVGEGGVPATVLWLTLGLLLHAVILFAYFTATGMPLLIVILFALLALLALGSAWRPPVHRDRSPARLGAVAAVAAVLLVASVVVTSTMSAPEAGEPLPAEFTAMTYNIQSGFSVDNVWDLEATARVIEAADPDVVILQEVGRGWPILTGVDQARWLSDRLGMQLVWGPASQDDLWGNAILTTAPIISTDWVKYDTTENLRRGAVVAVLESENGPVAVIGTHLDNPGSATTARQEQIGQLLEFWGGQGPALIAGDLNTDPDSEAMASIIDAGFSDTGTVLGEDAATSEDARRIDYVLITPGLEVVDARIPDTWASDHLPFVTTLRIAP